MIEPLLSTLIIEGAVLLGYCLWRNKPLVALSLTSIVGNLLTQSMLWTALRLFFNDYWVTLLIAEILIWILESILFFNIPANRLTLSEAVLLSLGMNGTSFTLGWFLPF